MYLIKVTNLDRFSCGKSLMIYQIRQTSPHQTFPLCSKKYIDNVVVIGTRKHFEVINMYKLLFLSQEMYSSSCSYKGLCSIGHICDKMLSGHNSFV